jgi:hypothetical protein
MLTTAQLRWISLLHSNRFFRISLKHKNATFGWHFFYEGGIMPPDARVAKLVDALDLGSSGATRESSSLSFRTNIFCF